MNTVKTSGVKLSLSGLTSSNEKLGTHKFLFLGLMSFTLQVVKKHTKRDFRGKGNFHFFLIIDDGHKTLKFMLRS